MEYTARLDRARRNKMLRFKSRIGWGIGRGAQSKRARVRANVGANKKRVGEEVDGRTGSLINSLTPSAIGWRSP